MFLRHLRAILLIFLGLHLAEIVAIVAVLFEILPEFVGDTGMSMMVIDLAFSVLSFFVLAMIGLDIQNGYAGEPHKGNQVLVLAILHFLGTLAVAGMLALFMVCVGIQDAA